jgi:hypothetical protein
MITRGPAHALRRGGHSLDTKIIEGSLTIEVFLSLSVGAEELTRAVCAVLLNNRTEGKKL